MRSERALKLAIAEMYVKGVSTRRVSDIVEILCGTEVSSSQVSRLAKELDEEITSWKAQPVGQIQYLVLDATYESVRVGSHVVKQALLVAALLKFCYVVRYYPVLTPGKSNSVAAYTILRMTWLSTHQSQKSILRMA
ncbi:hypothetical protein BT08F38_42850 [Escherichia coli]